MGDNIKVVIRVRPRIQREIAKGEPARWVVDNDTIFHIDELGQKSSECYSFDHIFDGDTNNELIYQSVGRPLIETAIKGINATIFAYGQTSSGKTYTMIGDQEQMGFIPSAVKDMFDMIRQTSCRKFLIRTSYIEIYNEKINDLLNKDVKDVKLREDYTGNVFAQVTETISTSSDEVLFLMAKGEKNRQIGETNMNERSSRSHTIFRIIIESSEMTNVENPDVPVQVSHLNFVDLAGSERVGQTKASGARLKEGSHINKSLTVLGLVIRQLSEGTEFINFRDSKLTRMLQQSLGGNAKTLIVAAITPVSVENGQSTLAFAQRAKTIKNKPKVNEILTDCALMKQYESKVTNLKKELAEQLSVNKNLETDQAKKDTIITELTERIHMLQKNYIFAVKPHIPPKRRHTIGQPTGLSNITESLHILETDAPFLSETPIDQFEIDLLEAEKEKHCNSVNENLPRLNIINKISRTASIPTRTVCRRKLAEQGNVEKERQSLVESTEEKENINRENVMSNDKSPTTPKSVLRTRVQILQQELNELKDFTKLEQLTKDGETEEDLHTQIRALNIKNADLKIEYNKLVKSKNACTEKISSLEETLKLQEEKYLESYNEFSNQINGQCALHKSSEDKLKAEIELLQCKLNDEKFTYELMEKKYNARINELVNSATTNSNRFESSTQTLIEDTPFNNTQIDSTTQSDEIPIVNLSLEECDSKNELKQIIEELKMLQCLLSSSEPKKPSDNESITLGNVNNLFEEIIKIPYKKIESLEKDNLYYEQVLLELNNVLQNKNENLALFNNKYANLLQVEEDLLQATENSDLLQTTQDLRLNGTMNQSSVDLHLCNLLKIEMEKLIKHLSLQENIICKLEETNQNGFESEKILLIKDCKAELEKINYKNKELEGHISAKNKELNRLYLEIDENNDSIMKQASDIQNLEEKITEITAQLTSEECLNKRLTSEVQNLRTKEQKLTIEEQKLVTKEQNSTAEVQKLTTEVQNLTTEVQNLTAEVQNLTAEATKYKSEIAELEKSKNQLQVLLQDNTVKSEEYNQNVEKLKIQIEELQQELNLLHKNKLQSQNKIDELNVKLNVEKGELNTALLQRNTEIDSLKNKISKLLDEIDDYKIKAKGMANNEENLICNINKQSKKICNLEKEMDELRHKFKISELEVMNKTKEKNELNNVLLNKNTEIDSLKNKISNLLDEIDDYKIKANGKVNNEENLISKLSKYAEKISNLEKETEELRHKFKISESEVLNRTKEKDELNATLQNRNTEIDSLKNKISSLLDEIDSYKIKSNSMVNNQENLVSKLNKQTEEISNLEKVVDELRHNYKICELKVLSKTKELTECRQKDADQTREIVQLKHDIDALKLDLDALKLDLDNSKLELEAKSKEIVQLKQDVELQTKDSKNKFGISEKIYWKNAYHFLLQNIENELKDLHSYSKHFTNNTTVNQTPVSSLFDEPTKHEDCVVLTLKRELKRIKSYCNKWVEETTKLDKANEEIKQLEAKLKVKVDESARLLIELKSKTEEVQSKNEDITALTRCKEELMAQVAEYKSKICQLNEKLSEFNTKVSNGSTVCKEVQETSQLIQLKEQCKNMYMENKELKEKVKFLEREWKSNSQPVNIRKERRRSIQNSNRSLLESCTNCELLQEERDKLKTELGESFNQITNLQQKVIKLSEEIGSSKRIPDTIDYYKTCISSLEKENRDLKHAKKPICDLCLNKKTPEFNDQCVQVNPICLGLVQAGFNKEMENEIKSYRKRYEMVKSVARSRAREIDELRAKLENK